MKLAASLLVKDELGRYLESCIDHLAEFCDLIVVWDDGSADDTIGTLAGRHAAMRLHGTSETGFFAHEGRTRQRLLDATLSWEPTHVLAIDADELVADGPALRRALDRDRGHLGVSAWQLNMREVWEADQDGLCVREDGGWASHPVAAVWRVPPRLDASWRIADRALACGRVPVAVNRAARRAQVVGDLLHFGWTNEAERAARHDRYVKADNGRFHARRHLDSIRWGCDRVRLEPLGWPAGLAAYKDAVLARASGVTA